MSLVSDKADAAVALLLAQMQSGGAAVDGQVVELDDGRQVRCSVIGFRAVDGTGSVVRFIWLDGDESWIKRVCSERPEFEMEWQRARVN